MNLIFDTETTGKANHKLPPEHESQPRIVQFACGLYDDLGNAQMEVSLLVKPDGFQIPLEATMIHGISQQQATLLGVPISFVLYLFGALAQKAKTLIAYSFDYDELVLKGEYHRSKMAFPMCEHHLWCDPMMIAKDQCKLPGNYGDFKFPKLVEAYRHFFGKDFDGAHSALGDVRATAELFFHLKALNLLPV